MSVENMSRNYLQRFLIVGALSTCINYGIYMLVYLVLKMSYEWAFVIGFLSGIASGYFLNRAWAFQVKSTDHQRNIWKYLTVYTTTLLIGLTFFKWAVKGFGVDPIVANFGIILITTCINYAGTRFWVFRQ
jgi:putative flippase GtrA